jgi:riboflavin synthase alpha subunit
VGLIPETLKRTNLGNLNAGERVNLEIDNMARGLVHFAKVNKDLQL